MGLLLLAVAEQLKEVTKEQQEEVALAVVGRDHNANGAPLVASLLWLVLSAGWPDKRYGTSVAHYPIRPAPQGM